MAQAKYFRWCYFLLVKRDSIWNTISFWTTTLKLNAKSDKYKNNCRNRLKPNVKVISQDVIKVTQFTGNKKKLERKRSTITEMEHSQYFPECIQQYTDKHETLRRKNIHNIYDALLKTYQIWTKNDDEDKTTILLFP